jgi:hypothetical protein
MLTFLPGNVAFEDGLIRGIRRETATFREQGVLGWTATLVQQERCKGRAFGGWEGCGWC